MERDRFSLTNVRRLICKRERGEREGEKENERERERELIHVKDRGNPLQYCFLKVIYIIF